MGACASCLRSAHLDRWSFVHLVFILVATVLAISLNVSYYMYSKRLDSYNTGLVPTQQKNVVLAAAVMQGAQFFAYMFSMLPYFTAARPWTAYPAVGSVVLAFSTASPVFVTLVWYSDLMASDVLLGAYQLYNLGPLKYAQLQTACMVFSGLASASVIAFFLQPSAPPSPAIEESSSTVKTSLLRGFHSL